MSRFREGWREAAEALQVCRPGEQAVRDRVFGLDDLTLHGEFAVERGNGAGVDYDASAWYAQADYAFPSVALLPLLSYRYAYFYRTRRTRHLGLLGYLLFPLLGMCVNLYLVSQLSSTAITIGLCWLAIGVIYLIWLTRGLRRSVPEQDMNERVGG